MARPSSKKFLGNQLAKGQMVTNFTDSIKAQVDRKNVVASEWICKNFRHPKNDRLNWSFKDHEFQIEIADLGDNAQEASVKKCAQVGLSTLQINWLLTFCAQHDLLKIAYVLPTAKFATEFSALRVEPAILASPAIAALVSSDVDNVGAKKIGTCFMVMRGTSGESQAISIDLDAIVIDEINFCNQKILSAMESRLQHSDLKLKRKFSTPTLPNYGISAEYNQSSQAIRMVKCSHCNTWVAPDFFKDVVIPGFDRDMKDYRKGDHMLPGLADAYMKCSSCSKEISTETLADPARREWVHQWPDRLHRGYWVKPWDVPRYNPLPQVLMSIKDRTYQDWCNFVLGEDHEDADNSFLLAQVDANSTLPVFSLAQIREMGLYGCYIGADLGKTNHVMVGRKGQSGALEVICAGRVTTDSLILKYGEANFGRYLFDLAVAVKAVRVVVDHAPSWEPALYLHSKLPVGASYGAYYGGDRTGQLDIYSFNEDKGAVTINRTKHFDDVARAVNTGGVKFPRWDGMTGEMGLVRSHLDVMKKLKRINSKGQTEEYWDSTSDEDHYGHALGYLWAAYASMEKRFVDSGLILPPSITGVSFGRPQEDYFGAKGVQGLQIANPFIRK